MSKVIQNHIQQEKIKEYAESLFSGVDNLLSELDYIYDRSGQTDAKIRYNALLKRKNKLKHKIYEEQNLVVSELKESLKKLINLVPKHHLYFIQVPYKKLQEYLNDLGKMQQDEGMVTRFEIHIPVFSQYCPMTQTEATCALRSFIKDNKVYTNFPTSPNLLTPDTKDWKVARKTIDQMYSICEKCKGGR